MTAPELKPCPFCGGEAEIWRAHECRTAWIACMGKCVVLISKEYLSNDEAIAAWNRRTDLAAVQPAQVRDLISRMDAIQACQVGPSDEWSKATKSGYEQAATDCQRNILRIKPAAVEPQPDPRTAEYEQAYQYALTLADALMAKHYPDNKDWRPLGDLTGLLTQIDNMVAGKKPYPRDEVIARMVEALGHAQYGLSWAVRYFKDQDVTKDDPCPPCTRGLSATIAALAAAKELIK